MIISIKLGSSSSQYDLKYRVRDTDFARLWSSKLQDNLNKRLPIRDSGRFVGLSKSSSSVDFYCGQITLALKIVNQFTAIDIDPNLLIGINQQKLNILHDKFDQMCGPKGIQKKRSAEVQVALESLNESIHSLENILAQKEHGQTPIPYIYVEFPSSVKEALPEYAYREFSLKRNFGDLFIHYSQVGKSILDAYEDEDEIMSEENIRPLKCYDGSFDIRLRGWTDKKVNDLTNKLKTWMMKHSYDPSDKKWAIGWLVVADLIYEEGSEEEVLGRIQDSCEVLSVTIER